jgi:hypothetical protein
MCANVNIELVKDQQRFATVVGDLLEESMNFGVIKFYLSLLEESFHFLKCRSIEDVMNSMKTASVGYVACDCMLAISVE